MNSLSPPFCKESGSKDLLLLLWVLASGIGDNLEAEDPPDEDGEAALFPPLPTFSLTKPT